MRHSKTEQHTWMWFASPNYSNADVVGTSMSELDDVIRECITTDVLKSEPPEDVVYRLEGFGDRAYEAIIEMLRREQVSGEEADRAIRCLALLSRHDINKKVFSLYLVMKLAERDDRDVRSSAVRSTVLGFRSLRDWLAIAESRGHRLQEIRDQMPTPEQVRQVVIRARDKGLDPQQEELVEEALQRWPE
jgi:hypothetical protein